MYEINNYPCNLSNYTQGRESVDFIIVHYTATNGSAYNNCAYFANNDDLGASAHYFIDDDSIWCSVPENDTAWHCGNWWMNQRSIGIEVVSAGEDFSEAEIDRLHWLVSLLMEQYSVSPENVIRHYDTVDYAPEWTETVDPNKHCPAPYVDSDKWFDLWRIMISPYEEEEMNFEEVKQAVREVMNEQPQFPKTGMHCLIKPDGQDFMVYYDGVNLHALDNPDEMAAVQMVYRICNNNQEIPVFEMGSFDAPWFHRFADAVEHDFNWPHMG